MVHNGIEYADMQLIAEAYDLLKQLLNLQAPEIGSIFAEWKRGDLDSYLIEITAEVLRKIDTRTGRPLVDVIVDEAEQKGTGRWAVHSALDLGLPTTTIAEAVFARVLSSRLEERRAASPLLTGPYKHFGGEERNSQLTEAINKALYASKVIAYAQGFGQMDAASSNYDWHLDLGAIATIWRGGCIIRARFLDRIMEAYQDHTEVTNLLFVPYFRDAITQIQAQWRQVVSIAVDSGVPTPVFSSSLAYYDGLRRERGTGNLIQALRDYFGAHTYHRVDREGVFHTRWSQDGEETQVS
jgi:6-phosphogluconate dehydrogenase